MTNMPELRLSTRFHFELPDTPNLIKPSPDPAIAVTRRLQAMLDDLIAEHRLNAAMGQFDPRLEAQIQSLARYLDPEDGYRRRRHYTFNWRPNARYAERNAIKLIRALSPGTIVHWQHNNAINDLNGIAAAHGTDYSYVDPEHGKWVIALDPRRLIYPDRTAAVMASNTTPEMVNSTVGAAIHECSHTLYTPDLGPNDLGTYEAASIFPIWEDMYVNDLVLKMRLPGAKAMLRHMNRWTNPPEIIMDQITRLFTHKGGPKTFEEWRVALAALDYLAIWFEEPAVIEVPSEELITLEHELWPLREELTQGVPIPWDRRLEIYQEIADLLSSKAAPKLHQEINCQFTVCDKGGTHTPLEQLMNQPGQDEYTLGDMLAELQNCHTTHTMPSIPNDISEWAHAQNKQIDAARAAGATDIDDLTYTEAEANEHSLPRADQERVDAIKSVFKIQNAVRRQYIHGESDGKLSGRKLHKLLRPGTPSKNIFKRRPFIDTPAGVILILVDGSGSMQGRPYEVASKTAYELFLATTGNPDYRVLAWNYTSNEEDLYVRAATWGNDGELNWPALRGAATPSYQAMGIAWEYLETNFPTSRRAIIHFTDLGFGDTYNDARDRMDNLRRDAMTTYITVPVAQSASEIPYAMNEHPHMHIVEHDHNDIVEAVQDYILNFLK